MSKNKNNCYYFRYMEKGNSTEHSPWLDPAVKELLKRHQVEYISSGIYKKYIEINNNYYLKNDVDQKLIDELHDLTYSEIPISPKMYVWTPASETSTELGYYILRKINPDTGREIVTSEGDGPVFVCLAESTGNIIVDDALAPKSEFSQKQIQIIIRHYQELKNFNAV